MKEADIYYTAGLIDGEGSIMLTSMNRGKMRSPCVSVTMTTKEVLEYLKETHGGHIITITNRNQKKWKQSWMWQLQRNAAYEFMKDVGPYLKEPKKRKRAELIVAKYKEVTPRNGKYTPELLKLKEQFVEEFFNVT